MAVAPHALASQSALAVLRDGGNAIEAMVAGAATISIAYPHMNGIGGDAFWLIAPRHGDPIAIDAAENNGKPYDAAIALGCVVRGDTIHFEIVSMESSRALMDLAVARKFPLGNGIITVNTDAQAWARARAGELNKGGDAARAALAMLRIKRRLART